MRLFDRIRTFESLHLRDYRLLWLGQLTTSMGQWMDQTARSWLIYTLTGSALQLGLVSAARGIPLLLFGVLAGVAADRYNKKIQLIIAQVVNVILNLTLATLILTHQIQVWQIYLTGFLAGTVQAFQQPARQVLINELSGPRHLLNAIALNSAAFNLSRSLGPAICGIIIEYSGVDVSYYVPGIGNSSYTSQDQTIIQVLTPSQLRGRVLGIYFLNRGLLPIGSLIAGALAATLGGPWAVTIMGASCFLLAVGIAVVVPAIWNLKTISGAKAD